MVTECISNDSFVKRERFLLHLHYFHPIYQEDKRGGVQ